MCDKQNHKNAFIKPINSNQLPHPNLNITYSNTNQQRRGRPQCNKNGNIKSQAKHYITIWQAELNYIYLTTNKANGYASDKPTEIVLQKLIPLEHKNLFKDLIGNDSKRSKRLYQMLIKLSYARQISITIQFFKFYFFVLNELVTNPNQNRQQSISNILQKGKEFYKVQEIRAKNISVDSQVQKKQFQKLLKIICYSIIATYEEDNKIKMISDF